MFVSSATTRSVPPAQVAALRRAVAGTEIPMFVVVAPSFGGEPGLATLRSLPDLLHDRLGRDGIYLAVDLSPNAYAQAFGVEARHARPAPPDEPLIGARVFQHAHTAHADELREQVEERLVAFADRIDRTGTPENEGAQQRQQHALDAYAAARRVLASRPEMVDLAQRVGRGDLRRRG